MVFLCINPTNYDDKDSNGKNKIDLLNELIASPNSKIFILFYMDGCGPCNLTKPEWKKLQNVFKKYKNNTEIGIIDIDQILLNKIKHISSPSGFPSMKYVTNKGKTIENYEDSNVTNKDRTVDSFAEWIKEKLKSDHNSETKQYFKGGSRTRRRKMGGRKWSLKYKKSINCKKPKGFSQRQYCKYGRK